MIEHGIRSLEVLLTVLQETVTRMGWGVQRGHPREQCVEMFQGWRTWSKSNWLGESFREDVFQYTSLLDRSASHWRELDAGQTQPETRRTSGDIKASGDGKTVMATANDRSTQAASNTAQVIRIILVFLS